MKKAQTFIAKYLLIITVVLLTAGLCSAAGTDAFKGQKGVLRISGGTAHIPVMKEAAKIIMTAYPDIRITIAGGGSGAGIKQAGEGLVQIGNSGRKPTDAEIKKYNLMMHKWAIDGVAAVVNPNNPVHAVSGQQLKAIFSGDIKNWKELGGADRPINLYTRDESSGTRAVFWKKALGKGSISAKANFIASNGATKAAISNNPYAIGYISVGHIDNSVTPITLDGVTPSLETVKSGQYKVARGLYSNTKGTAKGLAKNFIEYLMSPDGQRLASEKGFIPVK